MRSSEQLNELYTALALAQGEIEAAAKDGKNPHFKSTYATLESVIEAVRGPLSKNGLSLMQMPDVTEHGVVLVNRLGHKSGQWLESSYPVNPVQNTPQAMGSALTYARRYCIQSFVLVPSSDDDGNEASKPAQKPIQPESSINKAAGLMRAVESEQRKQTAKPTTEEQQVCSHKWLKSKFKKDEEYCMHCKLVRKITTDLGNIPF
jgi:hypothetical protein